MSGPPACRCRGLGTPPRPVSIAKAARAVETPERSETGSRRLGAGSGRARMAAALWDAAPGGGAWARRLAAAEKSCQNGRLRTFPVEFPAILAGNRLSEARPRRRRPSRFRSASAILDLWARRDPFPSKLMRKISSSGDSVDVGVQPVRRTSRGAYVARSRWVHYQVLVYDAAGDLSAIKGRYGEGPGDHPGSVNHLEVGPGDTAHLFHNDRRKRSLLAPGSWNVARSACGRPT